MRKLEWAAGWIGAIFAGSLLAMPISVTPAFREMVQDFGTSIPRLTILVFSPWFPPLLAVLPALCLFGVYVFRDDATQTRRRICLAASVVFGLAGVFVCLTGYYLPIFEAARSVAGE